jgi:hypothetical protein
MTEGKMPMTTYTLIHPQAKLSSTEVQNVCQWTNSIASNVSSPAKDDDDD